MYVLANGDVYLHKRIEKGLKITRMCKLAKNFGERGVERATTNAQMHNHYIHTHTHRHGSLSAIWWR